MRVTVENADRQPVLHEQEEGIGHYPVARWNELPHPVGISHAANDRRAVDTRGVSLHESGAHNAFSFYREHGDIDPRHKRSGRRALAG